MGVGGRRAGERNELWAGYRLTFALDNKREKGYTANKLEQKCKYKKNKILFCKRLNLVKFVIRLMTHDKNFKYDMLESLYKLISCFRLLVNKNLLIVKGFISLLIKINKNATFA